MLTVDGLGHGRCRCSPPEMFSLLCLFVVVSLVHDMLFFMIVRTVEGLLSKVSYLLQE